MTEATTPQSNAAPLGRRIRGLLDRNPTAVAIGVYALVAVVATVAAYYWIFSEFASYDDEGTLLMTVKAFAHGEVLYRDIWSVYGPLYYELFGGLFALTGHAVTTDASRLIVVVIWVGTSLMFGLVAHRLTGNLWLGVAGMAAAYSALVVLTNEPMHPQQLCVLLIAAFSLVAVGGLSGRMALVGGVCGALLAGLVLTKVNLGIFAVAAVALAAVMTVEELSSRAWLRLPVVVAFLLLPAAVLERDLNLGWVRELLLIETLAAAALIVAAWSLRPQPGHRDRGLLRWVLAFVVGFAAAFVAIIVGIVLTGAGLSDVYHGVVVQAFQIRNVLLSQFPFPAPGAVDWAIAALAGAVLVTWLRRSGDGGGPTVWSGLLRAGAGLLIWLGLSHLVPFAFNPSSANPDLVPLLLAWVAAVPPAGVRESAYKRFLRVLLPALAVVESLQVYPQPGSQMGIAAVIFVPAGALCIADALVELRAWSAERGSRPLRNFGVVVGVVSVATAGMFTLDTIGLFAASSAVTYKNQPKLPFPGAELMHLPPEQVETYSALVDLLHSHRCTTFIGWPSINSLYLWSGLEAPAPQVPNAWVHALEPSQQQRVLEGLRASPRPCMISNENLANSYLRGEPPPNTPLVNYVLNDFRPVASVGEFEFNLPVGRHRQAAG